MHKIFDVLPALLGRTFSMSFHSRMHGGVVTLAGLVLASIGSLATARAFASTLPTERAAHVTEQPESSSFSSGPASEVLDPQEPVVQLPKHPLAAEQPEAKSPQVTYKNGQLTIIAENSRLSDVLTALHEATGAEIELPAGASGDRIWVRLGPGPARRIVTELLSSTEFNYVIQASDTDLEGVRSVLLSPHAKGFATDGQGTSTGQLERMANRRLSRMNPSAAESSQQENSPSPETATSADSAPTDPSAASMGSQRAAPDLQSAPGSLDSNASRPAVRTSEQMIQQLQSMYQQRRQLQQNQKPSGPHQ